MRVYDFFTIADDEGAKIRTTNDGYLVATPRVARTGIQLYYGSELGMTGADANKIMKVYRPESEVFKTDSLATYGFKPVTDDHPPVPVTMKNWKDYAAGTVGGDVLRDGEFIRVPLALMDSKLGEKVKGGKVEISVGYDCNIDFTAGVSPQGERYDASQKDISINHVAVVDAARGGAKLRFGDATASVPDTHIQKITPEPVADRTTTETTTMKALIVDGITVQVENDQAAQIIDRHIASLNASVADTGKQLAAATTQVTDLTKQLTDATTKHTTEMATKDAELVTLKKQVEDSKLKPEQLDQLVKDRAAIAGKARALLGDALKVEGLGDTQIMRQVVDAKVGEAAKNWSDDQIKVSFETLTKDVKPTDAPVNPAIVMGAAFSGAPQMTDAQKVREAARAERDKKMGDAWKTGTAGQA